MATTIVQPNGPIKLIQDGELYTDRLLTCLGVLTYFDLDNPALAMGHHQYEYRESILEKWGSFATEHPDFMNAPGRLIVSRKKSRLPMDYEVKVREIETALSGLFPRLMLGAAYYLPDHDAQLSTCFFRASLDDLLWETNVDGGSLCL